MAKYRVPIANSDGKVVVLDTEQPGRAVFGKNVYIVLDDGTEVLADQHDMLNGAPVPAPQKVITPQATTPTGTPSTATKTTAAGKPAGKAYSLLSKTTQSRTSPNAGSGGIFPGYPAGGFLSGTYPNPDPASNALDQITKQGTDIASAATTNIGTATGRNVNITGTTTITALGTAAAGVERVTRFTGALTLTHNATSLTCITGANIVTSANDECGWLSLGSGNWRMQWYERASGAALTVGAGTQGAPGSDGADGKDGQDGQDAFPTLQAIGFYPPPKVADGKVWTADSHQSPGGFWDVGDIDFRYGYKEHDHFLQYVNQTGNKTQSFAVGGAGSSVALNTGQGVRHSGVYAVQTRATNDRAGLWGVLVGQTIPLFQPGDGTFEITWWFKPSALSTGTETYRQDYGMNSASTLAAATSYSFTAGYNLASLASGAMFIRVYINGVAQALVNGSTVLVANTWYRVRLLLDTPNGFIKLYLCPQDGVETLEATYTGTLPNTAMAPFVEVFRSLGTAGNVDVPIYVDGWQVKAAYANQV